MNQASNTGAASSDIHLPREAAKYIVLQRLETQRIGQSIHYTSLGKVAYAVYRYTPGAKACFHFYSTTVEPLFRHKSISASYQAIMEGEFATIRSHLPAAPKVVLSIGPGVGGLEVLLAKHYAGSPGGIPKFILIDKSRIDPIEYGFKEVASAYNSLSLAKRVLVDNGCPAGNIDTIEAETASARLPEFAGKVDLITSLIAWGFHFPVSTYLEFAKKALSPDGGLIIDVRRGTDGLQLLKDNFKSVDVIHADPKFDRVLARSPK